MGHRSDYGQLESTLETEGHRTKAKCITSVGQM